MTMNVEAPGNSRMPITLTDEALSSLPVYVSTVREPQGHVELEAALDAVALELRNPVVERGTGHPRRPKKRAFAHYLVLSFLDNYG